MIRMEVTNSAADPFSMMKKLCILTEEFVPWQFQSLASVAEFFSSGQITFSKITMLSLHGSRPLASPDPNIMKLLDLHAHTLKHLRWHHTRQSLSEFEDLNLALLPVLPQRETLDILGAGY